MTKRLSLNTLAESRGTAHRFTYDRSAVTPGIVHLGIGAFHRAHQAVVIDDVLSQEADWGIVGASLTRPDTKEALGPQDGLYALLIRDGGGTTARIIGSVLDVLDAPHEKARLLALMSDAATRVVSLTVTEKGYGYNAATGHLDTANADIAADLNAPRTPGTAAGLIVEALRLRRDAGLAPFTVMSCDNLPHNGRVTARVVTDFAEAIDPALGRWVADNVAFPGTMVDRIVPATSAADRDEARALIGLDDAWPVAAEPFLQWVVEDSFSSRRPPLDLGGAEFVSDVEPYEKMKLRMLNGAHSMIAYLGYLGGHEFVADVVAEPALRGFIERAWHEEIVPTLTMPASVLTSYAAALLKRFSNPALRHRTYQIAMDGSQKLPQRLVGTITDRLKLRQPIDRLALGVAAWIIYAGGKDLKGKPIVVQDPMAADFARETAQANGDAGALIANFLGLERVFSPEVRSSDVFRRALETQYRALHEFGPADAARRVS